MDTILNRNFSVGGFPDTEHLEQLLEFETLIAELSSRFINRLPDEVDDEIDDALRRVCELVGIDLAVLWQWQGIDQALIRPTHTYYADESVKNLEPLRQELFPWVRQQMLDGRRVTLNSLDELPAEAAVDRENARLLGIKSNLTLPLAVGGEPPIGALSLNTLLAKRGWNVALVNRLQLVAQVFTNALARRRRDKRLQESETRLAAGAELAGLAFYEVNFDENVIYIDGRFRNLCGIPPEREQGLDALAYWIDHLHPDDSERVLEKRRQLHEGNLERLSIEYRYLHPAHGEKWIQHLAGVGRRDARGQVVHTYGVLRDVTENKRVENDMRDLSRRLIRAQEDERALLARELHDDVTQRLAVLAIDVGRAELAAPENGAVAESMQAVRGGLIRLSEDVHSLAYQLHPSVLQELGLAEALRAECERRLRQGRLDLSTKLDPLPAEVGKDAALCLFRVAQEALNNVARHAAARSASVTLRQMDGGLLLAVRDDGIGFNPEHPRERVQLGLVSMRERVRLVNGTLDIESTPDQGTTIVAWVPVQGEMK
jgi:PAS domain S-box-containing protein